MKELTITLCMLLCISGVVMAQPRQANSAVISYTSNQKHGEAALKLKDALSDTTDFLPKKRKVLIKGYYYQALALARMVPSPNKEDSLAMQEFEQPAIDAHKYYKEVMKSEWASRYERLAETDRADETIWGALYNQGLRYFNEDKPKKSYKHYKIAAQYKPKHVLTNRMLGATAMMVQDTAACVEALETALNQYKENYAGLSDAEIDAKTKELILAGRNFAQEKYVDSLQLTYIVQQLAVIYNYQGEPRKALDIIAEGLKYSPGNEDIKRQELNIYNNNPELFEESKEKFEAAIAENPSDLPIKLAYGSLLERNGQIEKAFELFKDAYSRDPENLQANYQLAAYYINKAAELSTKKAKLSKMAEIDEADVKIKEYANKAYPYLRWLHKEQPNEAEWLKRLIEISGIIGKDEEMMEYGKKLGEINKN